MANVQLDLYPFTAPTAAGDGIAIDSDGTIRAKVDNTTIDVDSGGNLCLSGVGDGSIIVDNTEGISVNTNMIQEKLTAGSNITISGNTISANVPLYVKGDGINISAISGSTNKEVSLDVGGEFEFSDGALTLRAGSGLGYDGDGQLEVDTAVIQEKLIAGSGISIAADGKTISATGGGGTTYYKHDMCVFAQSGGKFTVAVSMSAISTYSPTISTVTQLATLLTIAGYDASAKPCPCNGARIVDGANRIAVFAYAPNMTTVNVVFLQADGTQDLQTYTNSASLYIYDYVTQL